MLVKEHRSVFGDGSLATRPILLYCVIAVLLNGVLALGWVLWREIEVSQKQSEQIKELRSQLKDRSSLPMSAQP